jgi:hypothetical protein
MFWLLLSCTALFRDDLKDWSLSLFGPINDIHTSPEGAVVSSSQSLGILSDNQVVWKRAIKNIAKTTLISSTIVSFSLDESLVIQGWSLKGAGMYSKRFHLKSKFTFREYIYVWSYNTIYKLDPTDGEVVWSQPAAIEPFDLIATDASVYCIGIVDNKKLGLEYNAIDGLLLDEAFYPTYRIALPYYKLLVSFDDGLQFIDLNGKNATSKISGTYYDIIPFDNSLEFVLLTETSKYLCRIIESELVKIHEFQNFGRNTRYYSLVENGLKQIFALSMMTDKEAQYEAVRFSENSVNSIVKMFQWDFAAFGDFEKVSLFFLCND